MRQRPISLDLSSKRSGVNLTPIMDVVFILIIFFMLAAQFVKQAEQPLTLIPPAGNTAVNTQEAAQILTIRAGQFELDEIRVDEETLLLHLSENRERPLRIRVDASSAFQSLVTALDMAAKAGRTSVSTETIPTGTGDEQ